MIPPLYWLKHHQPAQIQGEGTWTPLLIGRSIKEFWDHVFFYINLFILINLFLTALGLRYCTRAFSSCGERGPLLIAVCRLLIVAEHGL